MSRSIARVASACAAVALAVVPWLRLGPAHAASAPRIVSLIPSLTEDLFAIGAGPQVVAVSAFTDYPPQARGLPAVASFSSLDGERIVALKPDVVVGIPAQAALTADLSRAGLHPVLLPDDTYDDVFADLIELGRLSGHESRAAALVRALQARTRRIVARIAAGTRGRRKPRVFVVLGVDPIYTVGRSSYIATLIRFAGGINAADGLSTAYGRFGEENLLALQPDAIVTDRMASLPAVLDRPPWNALAAVREKRVYVLDDADLLERPGPRYNEGLIWLASRLHPDVPLR